MAVISASNRWLWSSRSWLKFGVDGVLGNIFQYLTVRRLAVDFNASISDRGIMLPIKALKCHGSRESSNLLLCVLSAVWFDSFFVVMKLVLLVAFIPLIGIAVVVLTTATEIGLLRLCIWSRVAAAATTSQNGCNLTAVVVIHVTIRRGCVIRVSGGYESGVIRLLRRRHHLELRITQSSLLRRTRLLGILQKMRRRAFRVRQNSRKGVSRMTLRSDVGEKAWGGSAPMECCL